MSGERTIPSLDGLRAVSVCLVLAGHLRQSESAPYLKPLLLYFDAATGVRIFFVISGFLITTLLLKNDNLPNFYVRRVVRLFPVQLAFVLALYLLTLTTDLHVSTCQFVTSLTYTKNYACRGWVDAHLWSLAVEEQFYLLWPIALLRLPRKWAIRAAVCLVLLAPISRAAEYMLGARGTFFWLTSNADCLMIGCLLALYPQAPKWRAGRLVAFAAVLVPTVLSNHLLFGSLTVTLGPTFQALAAAYLVASLTTDRAGLSYRLLNLPVVSFVGLISYSIYVWQQIFFSEPGGFGLTDAWPLRFPFNVALAFVAGILSYLVIERPFNALRRRLRGASSQTSRKSAVSRDSTNAHDQESITECSQIR